MYPLFGLDHDFESIINDILEKYGDYLKKDDSLKNDDSPKNDVVSSWKSESTRKWKDGKKVYSSDKEWKNGELVKDEVVDKTNLLGGGKTCYYENDKCKFDDKKKCEKGECDRNTVTIDLAEYKSLRKKAMTADDVNELLAQKYKEIVQLKKQINECTKNYEDLVERVKSLTSSI